MLSRDFQQSIYKRVINFFLVGFLLRSTSWKAKHKAFRYTICNKFLAPQTPCVKKNVFTTWQEGAHKKRKQQKSCFFFFFYLAFVEVVDDLLVEPLLQLPLGRRLVPIPLGEVGRAHVLRPLRQKQSVSGAWGGGARPL